MSPLPAPGLAPPPSSEAAAATTTGAAGPGAGPGVVHGVVPGVRFFGFAAAEEFAAKARETQRVSEEFDRSSEWAARARQERLRRQGGQASQAVRLGSTRLHRGKAGLGTDFGSPKPVSPQALQLPGAELTHVTERKVTTRHPFKHHSQPGRAFCTSNKLPSQLPRNTAASMSLGLGRVTPSNPDGDPHLVGAKGPATHASPATVIRGTSGTGGGRGRGNTTTSSSNSSTRSMPVPVVPRLVQASPFKASSQRGEAPMKLKHRTCRWQKDFVRGEQWKDWVQYNTRDTAQARTIHARVLYRGRDDFMRTRKTGIFVRQQSPLDDGVEGLVGASSRKNPEGVSLIDLKPLGDMRIGSPTKFETTQAR